MKVGIVGYGFVGRALVSGFLNSTVDLDIIDPKLGTEIKDLNKFNPDIVFVCVPTPMKDDNSQDLSIFNNVIDELANLKCKPLVVIKSTVLPNHLKESAYKIKKLLYNPEFLREKHAEDDFINSKFIIFGGDKILSKELSIFYKKHTKCKAEQYVFTDLVTSSLMKYVINSFLATKVIFFNEMKELFDASDAEDSWVNFIDGISKDLRIGNSHMNVPGHDGRYGFGGACFPKDTNALDIYADNLDISLNILKKVINTNNNIRAKYNKPIKRETDQNINFLKGDN